MKLTLETVQTNQIKCHSDLQVTLEDDVNVPDTKPDISSIIKQQSMLELTETSAEQDRVILRGQLLFTLLYASNDDIRPIHNMQGRIPFEETINIEGVLPEDNVFCCHELEDCQVSLINSRKISVRAICSFHCQTEEEQQYPAGTDILSEEALRAGMETESPEGLHKRFETLTYTSSSPRHRDVFRIRDEITLPKGKSNIETLLYFEMTPRGLQTRLSSDSIRITGDLHVFVLYVPEDEDRRMEYFETELPIDGVLQCPGCHDGMVPDISFQPQSKEMEIKTDEDGEQRILELEMTLGVTMKFYEDLEIEVLQDAYSTACELSLTRQPILSEQLLIKTQNILRTSEQMKPEGEKEGLLQICTATGKIQIDEQEVQKDGISLEGIIELDILYITENDEKPLCSTKGILPFHHFLEVRDIDAKDHYLLQTDISQINVIMLDPSELEAKVVISLGAIVFRPDRHDVIVAMEEKPQNLERLQKMPGIVGFIASESSSLWELAKEYQTSPESIIELNGLASDQIHAGDKLILAKQVDGL